MYKLLLVDDENQIREGLRRILNWEEYGIQICGEASDGEQALAMIEKWEPQIILTDIKMPGMDGVSLLKEIRKKRPDIKVIILSGYDDFSLVRQTMKYGAVDYLLKPVGKNDLIQVIEELLDQLEKPKDEEMYYKEGLEAARNNFFNRLISNSVTVMEFKEKLELLDIDLGKDQFAVGKLGSRRKFYGEEDTKRQRIKIEESCKKYLEEKKIGIVFTNIDGEIILILYGIQEHKKDDIYKKELEKLLEKLEKEFSMELFLAVSKVVKSYRKLGDAYQEAENTLKYIFIFETAKILYAEEIEDYFRTNDMEVVISQEKISEFIKNGNTEGMETYLEDLFGSSQSIPKEADYNVFRNMAMEVLIYFYHFYFCMARTAVDRIRIHEEKNLALQKLTDMKTLGSMKRYLTEVFKDITAVIISDDKQYSKLVGDALQQVKENYHNINLSLQYLADQWDINAAYLGRLFKKETGSSFVDYLNWYRVEKAEKLLRETNIKGSELCEKVGFSNYNYFYVVFKKLKGVKPMDIRENQMFPFS